jgi:photosystem II stability/assembly factor-like uncharacterized protein
VHAGVGVAVAALLLAACSGATAPVTSGTTTTATFAPPPATTVPAPTDQVTLAYVGGGIGLVGISMGPLTTSPSRLYLTGDFEHFVDVTPPPVTTDPDQPFFAEAFFLNTEDGWVSTFDPAAARVDIYRTTDGGRTWSTVAGTTHTMDEGAATYLQFLSPSFGYMDTVQPTAPATALSGTSDAGAEWYPISSSEPEPSSSLPLAELRFSDATHAVAFTSESTGCFARPDTDVWWSSDGGVSWSAAALPEPFIPNGATYVCASAPFFGASETAMGVDLVSAPGTARVGFLTSTDHGATWLLASELPTVYAVPIAEGSQTPPAVGVAPDGSWWAIGVTSSGREAVSVSTDQGAKWSTASGAGLPVGADGSVLPVSGTEAWVTVTVTVESSASLFVTVDAGAHWLPVVPEALP